jgi:DNA-binding NtrC family response regulator
VLEARDGAHALEVAERAPAPPDLVIADVVMPGMGGHQLAEAARKREPGLRVVYMSGHTDDVLLHDGARHGDIAFVQKPFTRDSLLRAVEEALDR